MILISLFLLFGTIASFKIEFNPSKLICEENEFACDDGSACLRNTFRCDGTFECLDESDEKNCSLTHEPCEKTKFTCKNGRCISVYQRCDGINNCGDNSDEADCDLTECPPLSQLCVSKESNSTNGTLICLPIQNFCNGNPECLYDSDEKGLCNTDTCLNSKCKANCHNTPIGPYCYCDKGLRLAIDGVSCTDTKPCDEWGICSQKCISNPDNTHYKCDCEMDYTLEPDGYTCKSNDRTTPYLVFSIRNEIRSFNLETSTVKSLISGLKNAIALDFYKSPKEDMIFWVDVLDEKIYRGSFVDGSLISLQVVIQSGLNTAEGLAVDWIGENLYWVESSLDQIEVSTLDGNFRQTIIAGHMESPRAIALDPRYGLVFWTDWDLNEPRIESASMSGEHRKVIFNVTNAGGAWPNGLTLDYVKLRIYWIDAKSDCIHSTLYDGSDHRSVIQGYGLLVHPFAISLFDNYVYWTDWRTLSVTRANKWNGTDIKSIQKLRNKPFDVKIFHPSRQPKSKFPVACRINKGGCSHLCLLSLNNTYKCHCPHLMKLGPDNKTCIENQEVLLFTKMDAIRGVDLDRPYHHIIPPINLPKMMDSTTMDFYAKDLKIYWTDYQSNEIKQASLVTLTVETIIDKVIENVSGLSVDWISKNIYLTSLGAIQRKIYVCNLNGEYLSNIIVENDPFNPISLAVDPKKGKFYWSNFKPNNKDVYIGMARMDGKDRVKLLNSTTNTLLTSPTNLLIDFNENPNRLYWLNINQKFSIQYMNLETLEVFTVRVENDQFDPLAIALYNNDIIFTSSSQKSLSMIDKTNGTNLRKMDHTFKIMSLRVFSPKLQTGSNACEKNNGGCAQLCLPISNSEKVCQCAISFKIDPRNESNCIGSDTFLLYSSDTGLKSVGLDGKGIMLPPISKVFMPRKVEFFHPHNLIFWLDSENGNIISIKTDTTQYRVIMSSMKLIEVNHLMSLETIAVDWISENIYWIDSFYKVIEVSRLNGTHRCVIISGDFNGNNSLVVHPGKGYLFWTNIDSSMKIERALLDGTEREVIFNRKDFLINDLAIDYEDDKIYWIDSKENRIMRMDLNGLDIELVFKDSTLVSPISIYVYQHDIYYVDNHYSEGSILKLTIGQNETILLKKDYNVTDVKIYHDAPIFEHNGCLNNNGGCQELCFYVGNNTTRCSCAHGKLSSDNKSCVPYDAFIMFSTILQIESIHISDEKNYKAPYPPISDKDLMKNVIGLTFDHKSKRIIYSDVQKGTINSVFFNGTDNKIILSKQGSVEGIAFDSYTQELFWTCNSDVSISKVKLGKTPLASTVPQRIVKLGSEDKPRGIAVDGCHSKIYWTNWNSKNPSIQSSFSNGYEVVSIITTDIKIPNSIVIDHKIQKLFWSDAKLDKIERCNLDGTDRFILLAKVPEHPFGLAVYGDFIFWTDWTTHSVIRADKLTGGEVTVLRRNIAKLMGIAAVAEDSENCSTNPCMHLNAGCSDLCSPNLNGTAECKCFSNRFLLEDSQRCAEKVSTCNKKEFQCEDGSCIPYELTCDENKNCNDGSDEKISFCATRVCPEEFFACSNGRCILKNKACDGRYDCPDDEVGCPCTDKQFKCNNGTCISKEHRCDLNPDCPDASDEMNCPKVNCSLQNDKNLESFRNCEFTTACLYDDWICDGHNDCWDMSDEKDCPISSTLNKCDKNRFRCLDDNCIPLEWVCDKANDCEDGENGTSSDEMECDYDQCPSDHFKCPNGYCIPLGSVCDNCYDGHDDSEECLSRPCNEGFLKCNSTGKCIDSIWVCDGENDCSDKSDEQNCPITECESTQFSCENNQCISKSYFCDGDDDCGDGSDEKRGCIHFNCPLGNFQCRGGRCIPKLWICNDVSDCKDGEDEDAELCSNNKTSSNCPIDQFECANKNCVSPNVLCDDNNNCGDYSDEINCNVDECEMANVCAQKCQDMPIGFKCSCYEGYEAVDGGKICKDIDECKTMRPCSQYCRNTRGSYVCSCADGYLLLKNNISCKSYGVDQPKIIFSDLHYIALSDFSGSIFHEKVDQLSSAISLDFDWKSKCIYWSDVSANGSTINKWCETINQTSTVIHSNNIRSPDGIAVDWVSNNLYWTDKSRDTIEVAKLDGTKQKILIQHMLQDPRTIVLDPEDGYMYWTDWGDIPYIGKAGMDGSNPIMLINESLGFPNALTIDYVTKELFWADAKEDYISVCDVNGERRAIVANGKNSFGLDKIFSITTFEDWIFWTDWETKSIMKCHKYHCINGTRIFHVSHKPTGIRVYHPYRQPIPAINPCEALNCEGLCLLRPQEVSNTFHEVNKTKIIGVCACPDGWLLTGNGSCLPNCDKNSFICNKTMKCIPKEWVCDRQDDCGDGSDEKENCPHVNCEAGQFQCSNNKCIESSHVCDRIDHCGDQSDEINCFRKSFILGISLSFCTNYCLNGAECVLTHEGPKCNCIQSWTGARCEVCNCSENCEDVECNEKISCGCHEGKCSNGKCICKIGWEGEKCDIPQDNNSCKNYCENGGKCRLSESNLLPICRCPPNFSGKRCENNLLPLSQNSNNVLRYTLYITPFIILIIMIFIFLFKMRQRIAWSRPYLHRRMKDPPANNVEISNPLFGDDIDEDSYPSDHLSRSFSLELDEKTINFTNPMYEYNLNREDDKTTLMVQKNSDNSEDIKES